MFKELREKYANYLIKKIIVSNQRSKATLNFDTAQNIALLIDASNERDYNLIKDFIKELREQKKNIKSISYFNQKETPKMEFSKLEYDFISNKELNWHYKANDIYIPAFVNENFDVLINLSINSPIPLNFIAAESKAKFKIGADSNWGSKIYDLHLELSIDTPQKTYLEHLKHYLKLIHSK